MTRSYKQGVNPKDPSIYGRGTTPSDITSRNTSLQFHEGSHRQDILDYFTNNPLPQFKGTVGMTREKFDLATKNFASDIDN